MTKNIKASNVKSPHAAKPVCPNHLRDMYYSADNSRWQCEVPDCESFALHRDSPQKPRPKTLMEVFAEQDDRDAALAARMARPLAHSIRPTNLELRIETGKDDERYLLYDFLLDIEIDITEYVEDVITNPLANYTGSTVMLRVNRVVDQTE